MELLSFEEQLQIATQMSLFDTKIQSTESDIPRDGNCLFNSLFKALRRNGVDTLGVQSGRDMRLAIVDFVKRNEHTFVFNCFKTVEYMENCDAPDHFSADIWADEMRHDTVFGDNLCLIAASRLFKVMVVVKSISHNAAGLVRNGYTNFGGEFQSVNGYITLTLEEMHYYV